MPLYIDQMGEKVLLKDRPERIISLVPSQSEYLWDLGVGEYIAGITRFCIHPQEMFRVKPRVGGTKKLNIRKIIELRPDLIIGNREENERSDIEELKKHFPVWMSDVFTLNDAFSMMNEIALIVGREQEAARIVGEIRSSMNRIKNIFGGRTVAYLIWKDPYMAAGNNTFIDHVLDYAGFTNVFRSSERYPVISPENLQEKAPEFVFLSSEPYPFGERHRSELAAILPSSRIMVVNGEIFSWYGSRLLKSASYLQQLGEKIDSGK